MVDLLRYIPVPTGNSGILTLDYHPKTVYPCTYRELDIATSIIPSLYGISLYLQGTLDCKHSNDVYTRYIPVPTGNSRLARQDPNWRSVYPCTYRELIFLFSNRHNLIGISLYLQGTRGESSRFFS